MAGHLGNILPNIPAPPLAPLCYRRKQIPSHCQAGANFGTPRSSSLHEQVISRQRIGLASLYSNSHVLHSILISSDTPGPEQALRPRAVPHSPSSCSTTTHACSLVASSAQNAFTYIWHVAATPTFARCARAAPLVVAISRTHSAGGHLLDVPPFASAHRAELHDRHGARPAQVGQGRERPPHRGGEGAGQATSGRPRRAELVREFGGEHAVFEGTRAVEVSNC